MLNWLDDQRFVLGDLTFQALPPGLFTDRSGFSMEGADFLIAKSRKMVDWYVALIESLRPRHVVELGVLQGGSTALFMELARPRRLVAIDHRKIEGGPLIDHISRRGLGSAVRVHGGVDQSDRARLAGIVSEAFHGDALDLIVDDCSHKYAETRASFNELFPRLRPGGIYVIEDWPWAHTSLGTEPLDGVWPDQVPLTRLLFELLLAIPSVPGLIAELTVSHELIAVERGDATIEPRDFEISACSNPRGRGMLAVLNPGEDNRRAVKPSVARDVAEASDDAWVSEPALGEEQSRWSPSASTWRSWNRMSPEYEFCEFVAAVVRLVKPELVIETGVGQGFTTRRIAAALGPGSVLKGFESDEAWRERLARLAFFHGPATLLAEESTPTDDDLASVDLLVADSVFDFRFDEVRRWTALAQQGSYIVVHDTGNGHPDWTPHQRLGALLTSLGVSGIPLPNPRGSFLGRKPGPQG